MQVAVGRTGEVGESFENEIRIEEGIVNIYNANGINFRIHQAPNSIPIGTIGTRLQIPDGDIEQVFGLGT